MCYIIWRFDPKTHFVLTSADMCVCVSVCPAVTGTSLQAGEFTDDITGLLDLMMARKMIRFKDGGEVAVHGNARKRTRKHASAPRRQPLAPA